MNRTDFFLRGAFEDGGPRVYIATRLENYAQHNVLRDALAVRGIGLSYDWSAHGPVWAAGCERISEVSDLEMRGVLSADLVVVLLPGGRGTHVELGIAMGARKPVVIWSGDCGVFEAAPETCAFYHHRSVANVVCEDMEDLAEVIVRRLAGAE